MPDGTALLLVGGWDGHHPHAFAERWQGELERQGLAVRRLGDPEALARPGTLDDVTLVVPLWTMGEIGAEAEQALVEAVRGGVGLAGFHAMADAFRRATGYQWMVGGQFVAHPGDVRDYEVRIVAPDDPITRGLGGFAVRSEQYYLHVDPSNEVLATTTFSAPGEPWLDGVEIPAAWKRRFGAGRVFYQSVGHQPGDHDIPEVAELTRRGLLWAAGRL